MSVEFGAVVRPDSSALPIIQLDEGDEATGESPRTVLITGASGNIGRKLRAAWHEKYDLILIDQAANPDDPDAIAADIATWDEEWTALFDEVDAVVHLAANPSPTAEWPDLAGPNLDGLFHVFHAAATSGVERLVFASSNHAMGGYRDADGPITPALPPRPDGPYGASKLVGERLGVTLARLYEFSFVALRLGWIQEGENRPETLPDAWARSMWLSNDDLITLFTRAVEAELEPGTAIVANGVSRNRGSRWTLDEARERLGYEPREAEAGRAAGDAAGGTAP
jgi:NAD+ dependent glucose-6-phosphate dehydrogenase